MDLARKYKDSRKDWEARQPEKRQGRFEGTEWKSGQQLNKRDAQKRELARIAAEGDVKKGVQKTKNKGALKKTEMREKGSTKRTGMRQKSAMTLHEDQMAMKKKKNQQEQLKELMAGQTDVDGYVIPGTQMSYNKALKALRFRQRAMEEGRGQGQSQLGGDQPQTGGGGPEEIIQLDDGTFTNKTGQMANQGAMQQTGVGGNKSNVFKEDSNLNKSKPGFGLATAQTVLPQKTKTGGLQSLTKQEAKEKEFVDERASGSDREKGTLGTIRGGRTVYLENGRVMVRRPNGKVGPATEEDLKELEYLQ